VKTTTALALAAVGAVLAFAVTAHLHWFSFEVAGWVLMATGLLGVVLPRRKQGWLRRRTVVQSSSEQTKVARGRRRYSRLLVPAGVMAEEEERMALPAESEVVVEYREE